ncbi:hypothetical protein SCHPADRAFT_379968 [Schizopora paradoxa]|uniref:Uncharacterized protein n=1 Tax=Schizopora paradoxa TaxID=27342 RepID=A0A0H2RMQ0_9AGAM|nr:hypothetical protein SCHPADRAFT_379968 [Schizopora paradoxa]
MSQQRALTFKMVVQVAFWEGSLRGFWNRRDIKDDEAKCPTPWQRSSYPVFDHQRDRSKFEISCRGSIQPHTVTGGARYTEKVHRQQGVRTGIHVEPVDMRARSVGAWTTSGIYFRRAFAQYSIPCTIFEYAVQRPFHPNSALVGFLSNPILA